MSKVFNYIRVSTKEQNEGRQLEAMNKWNKENNVTNAIELIDKCSGTNTDRPNLQILLKGTLLSKKQRTAAEHFLLQMVEHCLTFFQQLAASVEHQQKKLKKCGSQHELKTRSLQIILFSM